VDSLAPTLVPPAVADVRTILLPTPAASPHKAIAPPPVVAGYEVLGVLGHGGMGVVYKARHLRLNRLVALKMVLAGAHADPQQLARLHLEAEALADLQHPNIVAVYEVGEHDHCPYLALEFVDGGSLDKKLDRQPQPPLAAAELVETLARAMHCAHQRGIVHRDLKPANVLLTSTGVPKITDFGLAKRLEAPGQTQSGAVMGTPSYMAPEQAAGKTREAGPLADVYALGAILYEMLTGQPPFQADTLVKTIEQVVSDEPVAPSRVRERVPRDLETICLKCLQKEPKKRYASAAELAEDLRRFRADEPITARPVSRAERTRKWIKRRPAQAALVLLSGLVALGLVVGVLWHNVSLRAERDRAEANRARAEKNFDRAGRAVDEMLTEVAEEQLAYEPRMEKKRRNLLVKALRFYQNFLQEKSDDPALRRKTAKAWKRVADISRLLRDDKPAEEAYEQAIALLAALIQENPGDGELRQLLAESHNFRGEVLRLTDRPAQAKEAYEEALRIQRQLVEDFPEVPTYRQDQARTLYNLGILAWSTNKPQEAKEQFGAAIALLKDLTKRYSEVAEYRQHLARCYLNQGPVLRVTDGFDMALDSYDNAIKFLQDLRGKHPYVPDYQHELGVTFNNRGILLASVKQYKAAADAHKNAREVFDKLVTNFPNVPDYRKELAKTNNELGNVRTRDHLWAEAEERFQQARQLFAELVKEFPEVVDYQAHLAMTLGNLAWLRTEQDDWKGARPLLKKAIDLLKEALKPNPENRFCRQTLRTQYQTQAETLVRLQDHAGAAEAAAALPEVFGDRAQDYYYAACFLARCMPLAQDDTKLGSAAQRKVIADGYGDQAVDMLRQALQKDCTHLQRLPKEVEVFRPLQPRQDFQKLHAELQARTAATAGKAAP
jgi:serine/threonine-protein kinase